MNILNFKAYYFLGIGGIGMSALARFFKHHKKTVAGYDRSASSLTGSLENEGITCHFEDLPEQVKSLLQTFTKEEVLVVYTPAVPASLNEFRFLEQQGYRMLKRAAVLGEITRQYKTIAIAGTHGKTTTTTLVTHLLRSAGLNCFSFMGGISKNYNTNLILGDVKVPDPLFVVEADEYDRSFLTLEPFVALITSVDADHLDIYGDPSSVKEGYRLFARKLRPDGTLLVKKNVDNELAITGERLIYSLNLDTEYRAGSIRVDEGQFVYDILTPKGTISDVVLGLQGLHNVENSIAAVAIAQQFGIGNEEIRQALRSFQGVKRRFDYRVKRKSCVYIDDYAHHPEELRATISSVKRLYPDSPLCGIFQPHLFSRTRDFVKEFAESLDLLDECILLEIYPAREQPIQGVSSEWLKQHMKKTNTKVLRKEELLEYLQNEPKTLLLTMGAGDIDKLVEPIELLLKAKYKE